MFLHERWASSILITDSTYTIDSWNLVNTVDDASRLAFKPNFDLLMRLLALKTNRGHHILHKVRSHQWDGQQCNGEIRFHVVGNEFADHAAKRANRQLNLDMVHSLAEDTTTALQEWQYRKQLYLMLTELHETQTTMATNQNLKEDLQADEPFSSNLNASIFNVLEKYAPTDGFNIVVDWPADIT